jgi:magnesium transporter
MLKELLHTFHLEDIQSSEHPSDFIVKDPYNILILRLPELENESIKTISYAFVVYEEKCYLYDREGENLSEIGSLTQMSDFIDDKIELLIKKIKWYHYEVENLEEELYDETFDNNFMQKWLNYKKNTSLIYRLMFHATLSFELFTSHHKRHNSASFEELAYADLLEHMERIRDMAQDAMDRLDHLYDFYRAKVDEKMNRNVYYLTLLSGLFLPLTLITGFFGMNTGGLLWVGDPHGTWKVIGISIVLELLFFLPFYFLNKKKSKQ